MPPEETEKKETTTDLALIPVQPLFTPEEAAAAARRFKRVKAELLDKNDYVFIAGEKRIKKSGFRKLLVAFGLSDRIVDKERTDRVDGSFTWRITVEVRHPNGRVCSGIAMCDSLERKFAHLEHDVLATCHTRAKNRAISDMIAGGVVSAEEMDPTTGQADATTTDLDVAGIVDALESAGLDTEDLDITIDLEGTATVKPKRFLDKEWESYKNALWPIGLSWVKSEGAWKGRPTEAPDD